MSVMTDEKRWLESYPEELEKSLDYPDVPITQFLIETAEKYPKNDAVHFMGKTMDYKTLLEQTYKLANYLRTYVGVRKGDKISIALPNSPQYVVSYYAVLMLGATVVQTNPLYTERELEYQLNDAEVYAIITLDLLYPRIQKIKPNTQLHGMVITSIKDYLPFPKNVLYPFVADPKPKKVSPAKTVHLWKEALEHGADRPVHTQIDTKEDVAVLQYTGGTTGFPKGVMLTHQNLVSNAMMCKAWTYKASSSDERMLSIVPYFHVYGMTVCMNGSIVNGACQILLPKFDVVEAMKTIHKQRPTLFPGAPTMYIGLVNHPDIKKYDLSSIKACISGSAALPVEVQRKFEELTGGKLVEGYGLSEAGPVTHANPIWGKRINGSIGIPYPDTEAKIIDLETGEELPPGKAGELVIKGPQVMKGYWNREEDTMKTLQNGWLHTGDIAKMDEDGYFYIVDRKKEMILASGFNVYPREIEEVLYEHPAIQEAAAIGVPDDYRGETVKAFIVKKEGASVSEKELDVYCREKLAAYKVPRLYEFRDELPKTLVGKILKRELKEQELNKTKTS